MGGVVLPASFWDYEDALICYSSTSFSLTISGKKYKEFSD